MKGSAFLAVAAVVACALVASMAASNYYSGIQDARDQSHPSDTSALTNATPPGNSTVSASSVSSLDVICQACGAAPNPPITLHSVASAEKKLNVTLVLPSSAAVSAISPSLKLLGVAVLDSTSPQQWQVGVYYSGNRSFVNGTSTLEDLGSNAIIISEVPVPLGVNSSEVAHDILTPGISTVCTTSKAGPNSSSTVQCSTSTDQSGHPNDYIVTQNGLSILVNPGGNIQWADGRRGIGVGIESPGFEMGTASVSAAQLLNLASTMTVSP